MTRLGTDAPRMHRDATPGPDDPPVEDWVGDCTGRMARGDRAAYELLFLRRHRFVEAEAARALGRRGDLADDVAGEAWLRIARGPRACPSEPALDGWLRRVVRSAAIDLLRSDLARRLRERRIAGRRPEAAGFAEDHELLEELRRGLAVLDKLDVEDRAILELRARTGATIAQIARLLGIGPAAVDSRLRRAVERARNERTKP